MNNMEMKSEPGKQSEGTNKSQDRKEEMISISSTTITKMMNDERNIHVATPPSRLNKNPLLIDLILDATLSNLPLRDLLSCRLVCQFWNEISLPKVKSKSPELDFSSIYMIMPYSCRSSGPIGNNFFLETMQNSVSVPCGKFKMGLEQSDPDLSAFQELINVCSNEIASLHLYPLERQHFDAPPGPGPDNNKVTFHNWFKALKNLTKLTITDFDFGVLSCSSFFEDLNLENLREFHFLDIRTERNFCSQFFDGFFLTAQNLNKMSFGVKDYHEEYDEFFNGSEDFDDSFDEDDNNDERMLQILDLNEEEANLGLNLVLNSLLNHGKLDAIKSFTFINLSNLNLATLVSIGEKGLKLEWLEVQGKIDFGPNRFYEFLETQKHSLTTLDISGESPETLSVVFPSEMKELLSLTLYNNGPLEILDPITYTSRFPNIRKIHVQSGYMGRDSSRILGTFFPEVENFVQCETLKELRMVFTLSDGELIGEDEIFQRVSGIFPKMVIRVQVDPAEEEEDDEILDNVRVREMTLKIFGN